MTPGDIQWAELARIEEAGLNASAPPQQRLFDGWLLRFNRGKAKRARCVNPLAVGYLPLDHKLAALQEFYRAVDLPLFVRITPFCAPAMLDAELAARGWSRVEDVRVMVLCSLQTVPREPWLCGETLHGVDAATFAEVVGGLRGSPPEQRLAHAQRLLHSPVPYRGVVLHDADGAVLACAQVAAEFDMVGLYDVFTDPAARSRGAARRLCAALLLAHAQGARRAYLQVDGDNAPARRVYHRLGFADAYGYHFRAPPSALL